jgi:hypothetical protein
MADKEDKKDLIETPTNIENIDVSSSVLLAASYNAKNFELSIKFKNGKEYKYYNVSIDVWKSFKDSSSKGSFYSRVIKGRYGNTEHRIS